MTFIMNHDHYRNHVAEQLIFSNESGENFLLRDQKYMIYVMFEKTNA